MLAILTSGNVFWSGTSCARRSRLLALGVGSSTLISSPTNVAHQWVEESFTNFEHGINWRSYVVCDVAYKNVNNWLWTPFIERRDANRMHIEIKFSMRNCALFPGN